MNWKLLLIALTLILGISARPADETIQESTTVKAIPEVTITERPTTVTESPIEIVNSKKIVEAKETSTTAQVPTTTTIRYEKKTGKVEEKSADENRELKAGSNLQLTSSNVNSELTLKESFHHGVAVPMTLEDYEKEVAREKDLISKAKKKIAMESSTPKEGISTWILLSGSNDPTTTPRTEPNKPAYRTNNETKKVVKNNVSTTHSPTTKKRSPVTNAKTTKTTPKYGNNKPITRVKAPMSGSPKNITEEVQSSTLSTTKKVQTTTKSKKFTTPRPKPTQAKTTTTTVIKTTTTAQPKTTAVKKENKKIESPIVDDSMVIDDEKDEPEFIETSTYLIMEAKDDEFNLPNDRTPTKTASKKAAKTTGAPKTKKKTKTPLATGTNSTKIKKKADKKTSVTKVGNGNKKPEKPITTQIYNYLAREVMPTVGVGLVGLVVTAGLATYFLGGPLTALRRSYDIASRRDDVAFDRSDDFGNMQDEGEMFGKVIAGMPENSPYRNNIRVNSYRVKGQPYPTYPGPQYQGQVSKYGVAPQQSQPTAQSQQYLRYRAADPYHNSYKNQYYQQQIQAKSNAYGPQAIQATENTQKFNIDSVDMTTSEPSSSPYSMDYDEIAQSYFPQNDDQPSPTSNVAIEQQNIQEIESKPQPQYVQPSLESERSEKVTIVNAQTVPVNHKKENDHNEESPLPTPEALKMTNFDDEYQNSIANAILNQNQKKFVVGTVIADNFEDNSGSNVPEHGPRRRRKRETPRKPAPKSLENNEIDEDERAGEKPKRESETITTLPNESATHELENETTIAADKAEETTVASTTVTYDISGGQNNIFSLFRRVIELKLRLGLNFLQNATLAFQEYLKGVEARFQQSPLFNPYANSTNSTRKLSKLRKSVSNL